MACFAPDAPGSQTLTQNYRSLAKAQPYLLSAENAFSPLQAQASMRSLESLLNGSAGGPQTVQYLTRAASKNGLRPAEYGTYTQDTPASRGLLDIYQNDLSPAFARSAAASASVQRQGDISDVQRLAPGARDAIRAGNPDYAGLLDQGLGFARADLAAGTNVSAADERQIEQQGRASASARGLGTGQRDSFLEALNSLNYGKSQQDRARAYAGQLGSQLDQFYGNPFQTVLGRQNGNGAQGFLGQAQGQTPNLGNQAQLNQDNITTTYNAKNAANFAAANNQSGFYSGMASY